MSKKRIISLALAGVLLLGGGVLGTRAYFTAKSDVDANLVIKTGTLKVERSHDKEWEYKGVVEAVAENEKATAEGDVIRVGKTTNRFDVVKPGDVFEKVVTIANTGNLHERIKVAKVEGEEIDKLNNVFDIDIDLANMDIEKFKDGFPNGIILAPKESINIIVKATLKTKITNGDTETTFENQNNGTRFDMTKLTTAKLVEIDGYQVNDLDNK